MFSGLIKTLPIERLCSKWIPKWPYSFCISLSYFDTLWELLLSRECLEVSRITYTRKNKIKNNDKTILLTVLQLFGSESFMLSCFTPIRIGRSEKEIKLISLCNILTWQLLSAWTCYKKEIHKGSQKSTCEIWRDDYQLYIFFSNPIYHQYNE